MRSVGVDEWVREIIARSNVAAETDWHDWFAWSPVRIGFAKRAWLETVERKLPERLVNDRGVAVLYLGEVQYRAKS